MNENNLEKIINNIVGDAIVKEVMSLKLAVKLIETVEAVSYTHLDVYKRQTVTCQRFHRQRTESLIIASHIDHRLFILQTVEL